MCFATIWAQVVLCSVPWRPLPECGVPAWAHREASIVHRVVSSCPGVVQSVVYPVVRPLGIWADFTVFPGDPCQLQSRGAPTWHS